MTAEPIAAARSGEPGRSTLLLLAVVAVTWGLNWPAMKFVLGELPVLTFRLICVWVSGPALLLLARLGGERLGLAPRYWLPVALLGFTNITMWYIGTGVALELIPAGRAVLLAYTMPLWVAVFSALLLAERLSKRRLLGLALGMAGIGVLVVPEAATFRAAPVGTLAVLVAALGWGLGTVLLKRFRIPGSVEKVTGFVMLVGGLPIFAGALWHDPPFRPAAWSGPTTVVLVYIVLVPMLFGQWAWFRSLARISGTVAAVASLAVPAIGVFSSSLLLGETLSLPEILALLLLVAALALVLPPAPAAAPGPAAKARP